MTSPVLAPAFPAPPPGWANLDYPERRIIIQATTQWEKGFRAKACAKEPWTLAWLQSIPSGGCLWNVGANVGSYVLIAGARGTPTVAIEPGYANYAALCNNILANKLEEVITPLCLAIGNAAGIAPLAYRKTEAGAASHVFGASDAPKTVGTLPTLAMPLDSLVTLGLPLPTHLLIDVDGAEPLVLAGAVDLLTCRSLSIMIEIQRGEHEQAIAGLLSSHGYRERERWEHRGGEHMGGMYYACWEREG